MTTLNNYPALTWDFLRLVWAGFKQDGGKEAAAALTYTTLFAIVPVMTVTFTILHALPDMQDKGAQIQEWLFSYMLPSADAQIQGYLQGFAQQASRLTGIGILFLVVTSVLMLRTIEGAMNRIWKVKIPRKGITSLLMYWAVLTLGPLCLGVGLGISSYVTSMSLIRDTMQHYGLMHFVLVLMPVIFTAFLLTLLYVIVPNCHVPIRKGIIGGIIAAILFELAKGGFVLFVKHSPSYKLIYGAFAAVPLFLLWIYISWMIVLGGAVLVRALVVFGETRRQVPHMQALLRLIEALWQNQRKGCLLKPSDIRHLLVESGVKNWDEFRNLLMELDLVSRTDAGSYVLTRDMSSFTLSDLMRLLPWPLATQLHVVTPVEHAWEQVFMEKTEQAKQQLQQLFDMPLAALFEQQSGDNSNQ